MKITPADIVLYAGLLLTFLNIFERMHFVKERANEPHRKNEERIIRLEQEVDEIKAFMEKDRVRIEDLEKGGRVLIRALSALLGHGIDGNNKDEMESARDELNKYLIER
jgi:hypothetical protein